MSRFSARETSASKCNNFLRVSRASREACPLGDMEKTRRGSAIRTPPTACGYTREPNNARARERLDAF